MIVKNDNLSKIPLVSGISEPCKSTDRSKWSKLELAVGVFAGAAALAGSIYLVSGSLFPSSNPFYENRQSFDPDVVLYSKKDVANFSLISSKIDSLYNHEFKNTELNKDLCVYGEKESSIDICEAVKPYLLDGTLFLISAERTRYFYLVHTSLFARQANQIKALGLFFVEWNLVSIRGTETLNQRLSYLPSETLSLGLTHSYTCYIRNFNARMCIVSGILVWMTKVATSILLSQSLIR